ncbi:unnamed protein product [Caenorhabditis sp. 36 PRJEB53466]|nr:unnamed protein product [Caenorhabditis sp. 36 PRJEB53466]
MMFRISLCVLVLGFSGHSEAADDGAKCNLWQGKCPPGWKSFIRPPGIRVCLKIVSQNATYLEAQEVCRRQYNSRVHGIGTLEEHLWSKMKAKKVITDEKGSMWIGARRKSFCYNTPAKLALDSKCKNKNELFEWDDQLTGQNYLFTQWDQTIGAPNGAMSNGAPEDCVVMNVHENIGYIDDRDCSIAQEGFLCGMTA